jgi:hypothetical protein
MGMRPLSLLARRMPLRALIAPDFKRGIRAIRNAICSALLYWGASKCFANSVSLLQC